LGEVVLDIFSDRLLGIFTDLRIQDSDPEGFSMAVFGDASHDDSFGLNLPIRGLRQVERDAHFGHFGHGPLCMTEDAAAAYVFDMVDESIVGRISPRNEAPGASRMFAPLFIVARHNELSSSRLHWSPMVAHQACACN